MLTLLPFLMKYRSTDIEQNLQKKLKEKLWKVNKIFRFE